MPSFFPKELIFFDLLLPWYGNFQGRDRENGASYGYFRKAGHLYVLRDKKRV